MIDEQELRDIAQRYGQPLREQYDLDIGPRLFFARFQRHGDRRGEVVIALERPNGRLLLHRKAHYRPEIYRLLSGGIDLDEPVLEAVEREAEEETGLWVGVTRFLALLEYTFHFGTIALPFASYVFHVRERGGILSPDWFEIDDVVEVWPDELPEIASRLRSIPGDRADWGCWRAIAHDVVAEMWE